MLTPLQAITLAIELIERVEPTNETMHGLTQLRETQASLMPKQPKRRTAKPFDSIEISSVIWYGSQSGTPYFWVTVHVDGKLIGKEYHSGGEGCIKLTGFNILKRAGWYTEQGDKQAPSGFSMAYSDFLDDMAEADKGVFFYDYHEVKRERDGKQWFANAGKVVTLTNNESEVK